MEKIIIFILCTSSISWIVVRSKLFQPLREYVTTKRIKADKSSGNFVRSIWDYLDGLFSCVGCFGVYSGLASYCLLYQSISVETIAYSLSGSIVSLFVIKQIK